MSLILIAKLREEHPVPLPLQHSERFRFLVPHESTTSGQPISRFHELRLKHQRFLFPPFLIVCDIKFTLLTIIASSPAFICTFMSVSTSLPQQICAQLYILHCNRGLRMNRNLLNLPRHSEAHH